MINPNLAYWNYLFYLSKYYEFIDTFIIILRGRKPPFLQLFHHIGAVTGMWLICITGSHGTTFFTVNNSFIHTIMYSYYALNVIGYKFPLKSLITLLQIIQLMIGFFGSLYFAFAYSSCASFGELLCLTYHWFYVGYLIYLFIQFYSNAYNQNKVKKSL